MSRHKPWPPLPGPTSSSCRARATNTRCESPGTGNRSPHRVRWNSTWAMKSMWASLPAPMMRTNRSPRSSTTCDSPCPLRMISCRTETSSAATWKIMDVDTGVRTIVHRANDSIQAPNWTPDGKALIYNRNGKLYRFDLATRTPTEINTDFADENNNDHVLSFDGKMLGISHRRDAESNSIVYTVPVEGGVPKRLHPRDRRICMAGRRTENNSSTPADVTATSTSTQSPPTAAARNSGSRRSPASKTAPNTRRVAATFISTRRTVPIRRRRPDANLADAAGRLRARTSDR